MPDYTPKFPIDYTATDFFSILQTMDQNAKVLLPEWTSRNTLDLNWVSLQIVAGIIEINNFYANFAVNESVPVTTRTPEGFYRLARSRGYVPTNFESGYFVASVTRSDTSTSVTVTEGTSADAGLTGKFSVVEDVTFAIGESTKDITFIYGDYVTGVGITSSDETEYQEFNIPYPSWVTNTAKVFVDEGGGPVEWTQIESFNAAISSDEVFMLLIQDDGTLNVLFGDGVNGKKPLLNSSITYSIVVSPTSRVADNYGNIGENTLNSITGLSTSSISHDDVSGGFRKPNIVEYRKDLILYEASTMRAVTLRDHEFLARQVNGVGIATAVTGSLNTTIIYCADSSGVPVSASVRTVVEEYVQARSVDGKNVEVRSAVQVPVDITINVTALSTSVNSEIKSIILSDISALFTDLAKNYSRSLYLGAFYSYILTNISDDIVKLDVITLARDGGTGTDEPVEFASSEVAQEGNITVTVTGGK